MTAKVVAIVPIKQESVRVKNKNFRSFCGRPLYQWIIDKLIQAQSVKKIILDTDSPFLLEELKGYDERLILSERPVHLRGDFANINELYQYDMSLVDHEHFLLTHCTNPLIRVESIDLAVADYFDNLDKFDSLIAVNTIQKRLFDTNGRPINFDYHTLLRTQDLPPIYEENSNIFIFSKTSFARNGGRTGSPALLFTKQSYLETLDIDTEEDFLLAEAIGMRMLEEQI